ncbi:MAG: hypothetical protein RIE74_15565 [Pseudomonadales bacterium]
MTHGRMTRRRALALAGTATAAAAAAALMPGRLLAKTVDAGLAESDLIYLTPLKAGGTESACQAEVWFVAEGRDAWVVTAQDSWRARALARGYDRARVWVGDVGVWTRSDGAYRQLPVAEAQVERVDDPDVHTRVLALFGAKYPLSWVLWGPRFRNGLTAGSRVMLRYRLAPA